MMVVCYTQPQYWSTAFGFLRAAIQKLLTVVNHPSEARMFSTNQIKALSVIGLIALPKYNKSHWEARILSPGALGP